MFTLFLWLSFAIAVDGTKNSPEKSHQNVTKPVVTKPKQESTKDEDFNILLYIVIAVGVVIIAKKVLSSSSETEESIITDTIVTNKLLTNAKDSFVADKLLTKEDVETRLQYFQPLKSSNLKNGYTENSIGKQLFTFLNKHFETVSKEYSIGGNRGTKIDFCIGNAKVGNIIGIELKLLHTLFKSTELQRLVGQLVDYNEQFTSDNLIILAIGTDDHINNTAHIKDIQERIGSRGSLIISKIAET